MRYDCYEILGITSSATLEDVKNAYASKLRSLELTPNSFKDIDAASEAYFTLSKLESRIYYDQALAKKRNVRVDVDKVLDGTESGLYYSYKKPVSTEVVDNVGSAINDTIRRKQTYVRLHYTSFSEEELADIFLLINKMCMLYMVEMYTPVDGNNRTVVY